MSEFHVGQEVVCVDDSTSYPESPQATPRFIRRGAHYKIRRVDVYFWQGSMVWELAIWLDGIERIRLNPTRDLPFGAFRFRPIKPEAIAIFREMCVANKPLVPVEP